LKTVLLLADQMVSQVLIQNKWRVANPLCVIDLPHWIHPLQKLYTSVSETHTHNP
jgi:hypothetical protein